ncbi:hypothetical protein [Faecalibacter sp. LW9]|uniref:hypothetical protein n=1 Tax=Faecalibacter sp. LW9 TaxID=3103144 RepID=UPI002AFF6047|nr:hypothetical protein [Faecalibacter sp. LW9]
MKKYILYLFLFTIACQVKAQMAIGSSEPQEGYALTVNGDVKATEININGLIPGMVYSSNGTSNEPSWKLISTDGISIPNLNFLLFSKSLNGFSSIILEDGETNSDYDYDYNESSTGWVVLPKNNQNTTFSVKNASTKVFITLESMAQILGTDNNSDSGINFACGIFIAETLPNSSNFGTYKLKGARVFTANRGPAGQPYFNFSLSTEIKSDATFTFNPAKTYDVRVACKRRNTFGFSNNADKRIEIGGAISNNINDFMSRTFLKINVFEPL